MRAYSCIFVHIEARTPMAAAAREARAARQCALAPPAAGRRAQASASHAAFALLKPWTQHVVEKLAAIIRVADALDRTRR